MTGLFLCLLQYEGRRSAQLLGGTLTIDPNLHHRLPICDNTAREQTDRFKKSYFLNVKRDDILIKSKR